LAKPDHPTDRHQLLADVQGLATGVGLAIRTARRLHLPVEPGVSDGRAALVRWAALLEEVLP
jgi:hypothetical protein